MFGLADLDELVLKCRDNKAKEHIREAVTCYKAGVFRSAIVATWQAIFWDFLHKLRQLEQLEDPNAKRKLDEFKLIIDGGDEKIPDLLKFESNIIKDSHEDFEFITAIERIDLERLKEDRHRCAHPSMKELYEPYQPTAEIARAHIRHAIEYVLTQEPTQGKSVLNSLSDDITSDYFPINIDEATIRFSSPTIRRGKISLIRNLFSKTIKELLFDGEKAKYYRHQYNAAINAIHNNRPDVTIPYLTENINKLIDRLKDEELWRGIEFISFFKNIMNQVDTSNTQRLSYYIRGIRFRNEIILPFVFGRALQIKELQPDVISDIESIQENQFYEVIACSGADSILIPYAIKRFKQAQSYRHAEVLAKKAILPLAHLLNTDDLTDIFDAFFENGQIIAANDMRDIFMNIFKQTDGKFKPSWIDFSRRLNELNDPGDYYAPLKSMILQIL